jgi:hypothetical protein
MIAIIIIYYDTIFNSNKYWGTMSDSIGIIFTQSNYTINLIDIVLIIVNVLVDTMMSLKLVT